MQHSVAPLQLSDRQKTVLGDGVDHFIMKRPSLARHAEGAVVHMPPSTPRDLGQLVWLQRAHSAAIELGRRRKRDMVDVEVQPHADGIRGDQIIDIAVLIHLYLRVARARGQRAHHNGGPTLLAA